MENEIRGIEVFDITNPGWLFLFDLGHGFDTPGKRSPLDVGGGMLLEWKFVREIYQMLVKKLVDKHINFQLINPESFDVSLAERVARANRFSLISPGKAVLISIHGNAAGNGKDWHSASGIEAFTSPGETLSDKLCDVFMVNAQKLLPGRKIRTDMTDGDKDKEAEFYVLTKSACPAMLLELGFYTNLEEYRWMSSLQGKAQLTDLIAQTCIAINQEF